MSDPILDGPEDYEPVLTADFAHGEQFWKFWTTPKMEMANGESVRLKVLSKKDRGGKLHLICFTETEDGSKILWAEGHWDTDAELVAFVRGIQAAATHMIGLDAVLDICDFTACDSWDKWNYKFREGTTNKLWKSDDGQSVKGNM